MKETKKGELAENYFKQGYNCCQAVLLAFADEIGLDKQTLLKTGYSFGGGIGRMREVCGTVSAIAIAAGLIFGTDELDKDKKAAHYSLIQNLAAQFKEENGSIVCRELLSLKKGENSSYVPEERTPQYYLRRPCSTYCKIAADILQNYIENSKN